MERQGIVSFESGPKTTEGLLLEARSGMVRLDPQAALKAQQSGALLIDTRTEGQRAIQGEIPGSIVIDRNVLEWRLDPRGKFKIPEALDHNIFPILIYRQGYSSSLAAQSLRQMGLWKSTDLIGGFEAWRDQGLPISSATPDIRL